MPLSDESPRRSLDALVERIAPVAAEGASVQPAASVAGRVLAAAVTLDRDSPACEASAMDGYAVRAAELNADDAVAAGLSVEGECRIGAEPTPLPLGVARRIYTGCPVPPGADAVVRLERVDAIEDAIRLVGDHRVTPGEDIRRRGENASAGDAVLPPGRPLDTAAMAALASSGQPTASVHRPLRVAVVTTGDELEPAGSGALPPWRLRDSNGPSLAAMLAPLPWVKDVSLGHADDTLAGLTATLAETIARHDAVVLTGGVSKGAYDFVPDAVRAVGGDVAFHRIAARPGRPTLGATLDGKPIVGLPGNPVSVLTAGRRLLVPALRARAGLAVIDPPCPVVTLAAWSGKTLPIAWWRPVRIVGDGVAELVALRGSGDPCGPAESDGFVEVPPGRDDRGPFAYRAWRA
ncbi:MAG: molybdopterin molybdotransferase MoeA [Planctomycetota bacterium]